MEFPFSLVSDASIKNVILSTVGATFGDSFVLYFATTLLSPDYRCKPIINYTRGREYALSKRAFASRRTHAGIRGRGAHRQCHRFVSLSRRKSPMEGTKCWRALAQSRTFCRRRACPAVCRPGRNKLTNLKSGPATGYCFLQHRYLLSGAKTFAFVIFTCDISLEIYYVLHANAIKNLSFPFAVLQLSVLLFMK